jgi:hypothetical protein
VRTSPASEVSKELSGREGGTHTSSWSLHHDHPWRRVQSSGRQLQCIPFPIYSERVGSAHRPMSTRNLPSSVPSSSPCPLAPSPATLTLSTCPLHRSKLDATHAKHLLSRLCHLGPSSCPPPSLTSTKSQLHILLSVASLIAPPRPLEPLKRGVERERCRVERPSRRELVYSGCGAHWIVVPLVLYGRGQRGMACAGWRELERGQRGREGRHSRVRALGDARRFCQPR